MATRQKWAVSADKAVELHKMPTIGYWSCLGGVEVKEIIEDNGNYESEVYGLFGTFAGTPKPFRRVIHYTYAKETREYITINNTTLYLDECIKAN